MRLAAQPDDAPRPSARLGKVAAILDVDESTVRKLLARGDVEGHRVGRVIRIYLDSVSGYQAGQRVGGEDAEMKQQRRRATAKHREAMAFLRGHGIG